MTAKRSDARLNGFDAVYEALLRTEFHSLLASGWAVGPRLSVEWPLDLNRFGYVRWADWQRLASNFEVRLFNGTKRSEIARTKKSICEEQ